MRIYKPTRKEKKAILAEGQSSIDAMKRFFEDLSFKSDTSTTAPKILDVGLRDNADIFIKVELGSKRQNMVGVWEVFNQSFGRIKKHLQDKEKLGNEGLCYDFDDEKNLLFIKLESLLRYVDACLEPNIHGWGQAAGWVGQFNRHSSDLYENLARLHLHFINSKLLSGTSHMARLLRFKGLNIHSGFTYGIRIFNNIKAEPKEEIYTHEQEIKNHLENIVRNRVASLFPKLNVSDCPAVKNCIELVRIMLLFGKTHAAWSYPEMFLTRNFVDIKLIESLFTSHIANIVSIDKKIDLYIDYIEPMSIVEFIVNIDIHLKIIEKIITQLLSYNDLTDLERIHKIMEVYDGFLQRALKFFPLTVQNKWLDPFLVDSKEDFIGERYLTFVREGISGPIMKLISTSDIRLKNPFKETLEGSHLMNKEYIDSKAWLRADNAPSHWSRFRSFIKESYEYNAYIEASQSAIFLLALGLKQSTDGCLLSRLAILDAKVFSEILNYAFPLLPGNDGFQGKMVKKLSKFDTRQLIRHNELQSILYLLASGVSQSPRFSRVVKKLKDPQSKCLLRVVMELCAKSNSETASVLVYQLSLALAADSELVNKSGEAGFCFYIGQAFKEIEANDELTNEIIEHCRAAFDADSECYLAYIVNGFKFSDQLKTALNAIMNENKELQKSSLLSKP